VLFVRLASKGVNLDAAPKSAGAGLKTAEFSVNCEPRRMAGEAYNVEMRISNDGFPIGRSEDPNCNVVYEPFELAALLDGERDG
jgi:hypothetical protein